MAKKKPNTNFRLGLNRQHLIEAAQVYGKSAKSAKKANTKSLEQFLVRQTAGKGVKVPSFTDREKSDIKRSADTWGTLDALKILTYRMEKLSGARDESNFLRLTMSRGFQLFYDGDVTSQHIDELISRLPRMASTQVDSDMLNIEPYYQNLFEDYANELQEKENIKPEQE